MRRTKLRFPVALLIGLLVAPQGAIAPQPASAVGPDPIRYTYDPNGRLSAVIDPAAGSAAYSYDATGNLTSITRRSSTTVAILEFSPRSGPTGTQVRIQGSAFSATPSQNTVKFNGTTAAVVSSTTTEIVATVPAGATTGTITVNAPGGNATSPATFVVGSKAPTISGFTPAIGTVGSPITITGTNFETAAAATAVRVNALFARVTSATTTSLSVVTTPGATGHVTVATAGGTVTSASHYFVPPAPRTVADIGDTKSVAIGSSVIATVSSPGKDALIAFDGVAGQGVSFLFNNVTLNNYVTVLAPDGSILRGAQSVGGNTFFDTIRLPQDGTYELLVDGDPGATGSIGVQLYNVPADATATATIGGPVTNVATTAPGQNASITFAGTANQSVSWLFTNTSNQDAVVTIYRPGGAVLRGPQGVGGGTFFEPILLPDTGTYTLYVNGWAANTGNVGVQLFDVPADATATATIGGPVTNVATTVPGQNASITFAGTANQTVSWLFSNVTNGDAVVTIYKPGGGVLRGPQGVAGGTFFEPLLLPDSGTYTISINGWSSNTGNVGVQVYNVPADAAATATIGGPVTNVATTVPGQNASITFAGTANQTVSWLFSNVTNGDAVVTIYKPAGGVLRGPQGVAGGTFFPPITLPDTGTYTVYIDGWSSNFGNVGVEIDDAGTGLVPAAQPVLAATLPAHRAAPERQTPTRLTSPRSGTDLGQRIRRANVNDGRCSDDWIPSDRNLAGDWRVAGPRSAGEDQLPLVGEPGQTALTGTVLDLCGRPLEGVTLEIGYHEAITDRNGQFLLTGLKPEAAATLEIDGSSANQGGKTYGFFEVRVDLRPGATTVLPYTVWLPRLDTANEVDIPEVIDEELVVTTPRIPGLELHIPAGSTITDEYDRPVTSIGITAIPVDRPPFPLPAGSPIPVYFTIQPGGAYVGPEGAWLVYPNYSDEEPGTRVDFWHYDPDEQGWYVYGKGTVTPDGTQVVPDADTRLWEFTGAMIIPPGLLPALFGPPPGETGKDGDPVSLSTGLFVLEKTDLYLPGLVPLSVTRTYRPSDTQVRPFGKGANWTYGMFLWSENQYQEADLILPDSGRIHYVRTSPGNGVTDATFESTSSPTQFYKSTIVWNGNGWDLRLRDGTVYVFGENAPLQSIRDRYGNAVSIKRESGNPNGNIVQLTSPSGRWITFGYDTSNRITSATDNLGRTVGYTYDANGYLWKVTDPNSGLTTYTYDPSGRMKTITDARNITFLTNDYFADGKVQKQTQADGTTYQFAYVTDANGKITQTDVTDPRNHVRRVTFDAAGYTLTDTLALGTAEEQITTIVRQATGELPTSVTDELGRRTDYTYFPSGAVESVTHLAGTPDSVTTTWTYSAFDQVETITDPLDHTTTFAYYPDGSLMTVSDPTNKVTTHTNKVTGQPSSVKDPTNKTTSFTYLFGDLVAATDPLGNTVRTFVDAAGRVAGVSDGHGNATRTIHDVLNRPTKVTDPLTGATQFAYDPNGNVLTLTDARNGVTTYTYDSMDRVATRKDALLKTESYVYDPNGNLTKVTDRTGVVTTYLYDALNRQTFAGFKTQGTAPNFTYESTTTCSYDGANRLRNVVDSASGTIVLEYDVLDRLESESSPQGSVTYGYDDAGRRSSMTVAGQPQATYGYDDAGRLLSILQGSASVSFTYDGAGRLLTSTLPNGTVGTYAYDDASRIKTIAYASGALTVGDLAYDYDAVGHRVTAGGSLARVTLPAAVSTTTYNANNQLTKWANNQTKPTYDLNGRMITDGTYTYVWNARHQLVELKQGNTVVGTFAYDGLGRRVSKTLSGVTTTFAFDGGNFTEERNASGTPTANLLTGGTDQTFSRTDAAGPRYLLTDALGSTVALADSTAAITTSYTYEPFGKSSLTGSASANSQQFTGRENDGNGLHFYRSRYYSPTFGRFISEDPAGFVAGDPNLYAYIGNDPINLSDPTGMFAPLLAACAGGALIDVGLTLVGNWLSGRKTSLGDIAGSAALGCAGGLLGLGVGKVISGVVKAGKTAGNALPLPYALTIGRNAYAGRFVYILRQKADSWAFYGGITGNPQIRLSQHIARWGGETLIDVLNKTPLSVGQVRAIEQAIIAANRGAFHNIENSIAPTHSYYGDAVAWGSQWLRDNGHGWLLR